MDQDMSLPNAALVGTVPPQAPKVERAVLAALLTESRSMDEVMDILGVDHFYEKKHQDIYMAAIELIRDERHVDVLTVSERLKSQNKLAAVGGTAYLAELSTQVSSSTHVETHARILVEYSIRRRLITLAGRMRKMAHSGEEDAIKLLDNFEQQLFSIGHEHLRGEYVLLEKVFEHLLAHLRTPKQNGREGLTGVPSGFRALDSLTGGWQPGDLIIIAARPSVGKTALALNMLRNAALDFDIPSAFFSLEMPSLQLGERLISAEAGIESSTFRRGTISDVELEQLASESMQKLRQAPIYMDSTSALSIMELRAKARRLCTKHKVKLIIVDYLQLMAAENRYAQSNREQQIASISRMLKALAKDLHIPIIAISQLNRDMAKRGTQGGKRPILSDLRESGAIEQDADLVLFLHRADYYGISEDMNGDSTEGHCELIIEKHRNGATGTIGLEFDRKYTRFKAEEAHTYPSRLNNPEESQDVPWEQ